MKSIKQGCQCRQGNRILNNNILNATLYDYPIKEEDKTISSEKRKERRIKMKGNRVRIRKVRSKGPE
jgi:hypothetical protein